MTKPPTLAQRQADRALALQKKVELAKKAAEATARRAILGQSGIARPLQPPIAAAPVTTEPGEDLSSTGNNRPWVEARFGQAGCEFEERTTGASLFAQPWTKGMVNCVLEVAEYGGVELCLTWPGRLQSVAQIHGLANLERLCAKDLRGMRTLMYPGTYVTRMHLQGVLVRRLRLAKLYRSLWSMQGKGGAVAQANTHSEAMLAALEALNHLHIWKTGADSPSLAELVPVFVFEDLKAGWTTGASSALERTLKKVVPALRANLRSQVNEEWQDPRTAPCALMVLHAATRKEGWKKAFSSAALKALGAPEVMLFDASAAAARSNYEAVHRIPDVIRVARESGLEKTGCVVVTDDPRVYFEMKGRLFQPRLRVHAWAAEASEGLLSSYPVADNFTPANRSNAGFVVSIVDRDAAQRALAFQKLADAVGREDNNAHKALMDACLYVLRLSNMPAGYSDLTQATAELEQLDFVSKRNAWVPVKLALHAQLEVGSLNQYREKVQIAIKRAESLIDSWSDATPMAAKVLAQAEKLENSSQRVHLRIILPNSRYILLAHRFLRRKLGGRWAALESRLDWGTLSTFSELAGADPRFSKLMFVGVNTNVLRVLLADERLPHGTEVLISYKQAESTLRTLQDMKKIEPFKPYRGRLGLLEQELARRLREVPNPVDIEKLGNYPLVFPLDAQVAASERDGDSNTFRFDLEGGIRAYSAGLVYRYEPNDDPPFHRVVATSIQPGDLIFEMSDELRTKVEDALRGASGRESVSSIVDPFRQWLQFYRTDLESRCKHFLRATTNVGRAREILALMVQKHPQAKNCSVERVSYWLAGKQDDHRPHASKDFPVFKMFCEALQLPEGDTTRYWGLVRKTRFYNQSLGRELMARYAEVLFQPESASVYRRLPAAVVKQLQQEALQCVYRVESVIAPRSAIAA
ncbi:hypothetical protein J2W28_004466 [Variovorax boronicumulans]|uniref:hypothetical protein n=1 Tax=Variovorax boronicumulans TaxID=436515 RepID=UPI00278AF3EE|nr:hypothetical protein [Variovorax boronicumulans]MDP9993831.1 hypothetical protein [Variovorax boronicumulans]MDQ0005304.1 hypothetical protein [Variovorax boronicumulans]